MKVVEYILKNFQIRVFHGLSATVCVVISVDHNFFTGIKGGDCKLRFNFVNTIKVKCFSTSFKLVTEVVLL